MRASPPMVDIVLPQLGDINTEEIKQLETRLQMLENKYNTHCPGYKPEMLHDTSAHQDAIDDCARNLQEQAKIKPKLDQMYDAIKRYLSSQHGGKTKKIQKRLRRTKTKFHNRKKMK